MEPKPHLHGIIDHYDGAAAGYGPYSLVDRKGSLRELSHDNHTRAELASSPRCYELGGNVS